jgi:ABC-type branched-subunit amino acid transport system substrate-binding protein
MPLAAALIAALVLAACGSRSAPIAKPTQTHHGHTITQIHIYSSLPLTGPLGSHGHAVLDGIKLALHRYLPHGRLGAFQIVFKSFNDVSTTRKTSSLTLTANNARKAAIDPRAVYYIGDFGSDATGVSLPVLAAAGIAQITPGDPYIAPSTTTGGASDQPTELLRLMPSDDTEAAAQLLYFKQTHCTRVVAVSQDDPRDAAFVKSMYGNSRAYGVAMPVPYTALSNKAVSLSAFEATLKGPEPCGIAIAGRTSSLTVQLTKTLHAMFPGAHIIGSHGLCNQGWTNAAHGGVAAADDASLLCTSPLLPLDKYKGGVAFARQYKAFWRHDPSSYALYGYEAAALGIATIRTKGNDRVAVRTALYDTFDRVSVLGTYSFASTGDISLSYYGLYEVDPRTADPIYYRTLTPP